MIVLGGQQRDPTIHIEVSVLPQIHSSAIQTAT